MSDRDAPGAGPLDLNLLRTFLAVHRSGSFTAAAHRLGLSQSTVTAQIRTLEQRLGRRLFERGARGVTPLAFADEYAARLRTPLDQLAAVARGEGEPTAAEPVHLAGPAEFLGTVLLPALAPLVVEGLRLRVATGLTDPLLEELRAGRHDLVVATRRPRGRTLSAVPLADEEFVLVAAPDLARRLAGRDLPEALDEVPLISYAEDLPIARRYWRHVFDRRLGTRAAVTVPDLRAVLAAVTAGAGWSVLPGYLCRDRLASGDLVLLHDPEDPPINTAYLVRRPAGPDNPQVELVRERLLAVGRTL
ncbi:LysR family transcriptional regulator [Kitasatospora indigofera]|uniref:LysR family transcriptional regulator n=1 Tax=Kitasatospora indigofera TaxID=67307 RepID=A0A919L3K9_9ACTN|nr:LysR family transcriptional regulator [Kitasatospora indigofera]GHH82164.1 LysR family transcriptional regulator [Kitasatospora indigofera]